MTLALHGKSSKRRAGLILAGLLAVVAAAVGGIALVGTAFAHSNHVSGVAACQSDGTYTITWKIENDYNLVDTLSNVKLNNTGSDLTSALTGNPIPASPGTPYQYANLITVGIPGNTTSASLYLHGYWTDQYSQDDHGSATGLTGSCTGKIQVHKYVWDGHHWQNQGGGSGIPQFTFDVRTGSASGSSFDNGHQEDLISSPKTNVWVTERDKDGYSLSGFTVPAPGNSQCEHGDEFNGPFTDSAAIAADSWQNNGTLHVCAYDAETPTTGALNVIKLMPNLPAGVTISGGFTGNVGLYAWTASLATPWSKSDAAPGAYAIDEGAITATASDGGLLSLVGYHLLTADEGTACPTDSAAYGTSVSGTLAAGGSLTFCVLNLYEAPDVVERVIEICKVVDDNGIPPANEGGDFHFDVRVAGDPPFAQPSLTAHEGDSAPACTRVSLNEYKIPLDSSIEVVEWGSRPADWVDAAGYPHNDLGTNETAVLGTENNAVTFYNKRGTRDLSVCKAVDDNGDATNDGGTFTFDVRYYGTPPYDQQGEIGVAATEQGPTAPCTEVTVPSGVNVEVVEWGARPGSWNGDANGYPWNSIDPAHPNGTALVPPNAASVTFHNKTVGREGALVIHKQKTTDSPDDTTTAFSGTIDGDSALPWSLTGIGDASASITLPTGDHTVEELAANGWTRADSGLLALATGSAAPTCPTDPADYTLTTAPVSAGATTHVCILNQKQEEVVLRTLNVEKVILDTTIPDDSALFTGTVSSLVNLTWQTTNGVGVQVANDLQPGVYHVNEDPKDGYTLLGFAVVSAGTGAACPDAPNQIGEGLADLSGPNTIATVCVYNRPDPVKINILKTEAGAVAGDASGWVINLSGCGIASQTTTASDGTASFANLWPCNAYTVSENPASKDWFAPVTPISVTVVATTPGQTYSVGFTNIYQPPVICIGCVPPQTPETPTATLTTPTATVTELPVVVTTPTATVEIVLGEKTTGPTEATPAAPETGSGASGGIAATSAMFAAMGLIAMSFGLGALALARRRIR